MSYISHVEVITHGSVYILSFQTVLRGCRKDLLISKPKYSISVPGDSFFEGGGLYAILKLLFHLHFRKKSCRNITYDEFKMALGELARKKYKDKTGEEAEAEVFKLIEGKSPVIAGVTVRLKS